MIDDLPKDLGAGLLKGLTAPDLLPATAFFATGAVLYGHARPHEVWLFVTTASPTAVILLGLAAFVGLTLATVAVTWFQYPALRLIEGYWWQRRPVRWIRDWRVRAQAKRLRDMAQEYDDLADRVEAGAASAGDLDRYVELEERLAELPPQPRRLLPTLTGNLLRSAEDHAHHRYGLSTLVTWPHLWLVIPEHARSQLVSSRATLDRSVRAVVWSSLFLLWTYWWWPAAAVAAGAFALSLASVRRAAALYGKLIRATYDLYRGQLYAATATPAPADGQDERAAGERLTEYLHRGQRSGTRRHSGSDAALGAAS
ncbi:MAG TPA: hypothetical protein VEA69_23610 [Tepidisphaeraceae bacterium]|nr:hypothetical protein [Tepidisphaeraceae bacterium]